MNSCKGQSACKSANNACKGQNSCKGKGFVEMTKAECDAAKAKAASDPLAEPGAPSGARPALSDSHMLTRPSLGFGLGLRVDHYEAILADAPAGRLVRGRSPRTTWCPAASRSTT